MEKNKANNLISKLVISLKKEQEHLLNIMQTSWEPQAQWFWCPLLSSTERLSRQILRHTVLIFYVRTIIALENYLTKQQQI